MTADAGERVRLINIVAVSPGDVADERDRLEMVVAELNRELPMRGQVLQLWRWETHSRPGLDEGGPQGLIDGLMRMDEADIVVGIFWKRFGTPTRDASSGTEHELRRAWELWQKQRRPDVLLYFCRRPFSPAQRSELAQADRVLAFRESLPSQQAYWLYTEVDEFERLVREHLRRALGALPAHPSRAATSPGIAALAGRLRVRVEASNATFEENGKGIKAREVGALGATLGCGEDADLRLTGPAAVGVSRRHLLFELSGRHWTVTDLDATNRTFEEDPDSDAWRELPAAVGVPIEDGMLLCLGSELLLRLEVSKASTRDPVTPDLGTGPVRIRPRQLEQLALAYLRSGGAKSSTEELAARLGLTRSQVEDGFKALRRIPRVAACTSDRGPESFADALIRAFPYLRGLPEA